MTKTPTVDTEILPVNHRFNLEDWDLIHLFKDTIWAEFIDESEGDNITRGGVIIPENARSIKDFYRIAKVLMAGPDCSETIKVGTYLLVPPQLGLQGLKKGPNGGKSIFLREELVMAVIEPKNEEAIKIKKNYE
jgi:co-chaperonin GroES (HSP10)